MPDPDAVYAADPELKLKKVASETSAAATTTVLMGTYLTVLERQDEWMLVTAFGKEGWVPEEATSPTNTSLKFFFVDVGQGDGVLIEGPRARMVVDGGPGANFSRYLTAWKYKHLIEAGLRVRLEAIVISHFDADHFAGLKAIVASPSFEVGTIYHSGVARFADKAADRPAGFNSKLGQTVEADGSTVLETRFSTLDDADDLLATGGLGKTFREFLEAAVGAKDDGRLDAMRAIGAGDTIDVDLGDDIEIDVLGPIDNGDGTFPYFEDDSHTINGHSVVVRFDYRDRSFLLGGDLNIPSEGHLLDNAEDASRFRVDVAKACHHGASEFTLDFLRKVNPYATVFSSGDNENYGHPQPDALGATGKHSRGSRPLIFSTELARSSSASDIHYGLINVRTNGERVVLAQMYEKGKAGDMWNAFTL
jgi:beta-lactamase superfamily II metal-dependent hydrolase